MAEPTVHEDEEEYLPSLASVYKLCDDDKLDEFVDAAVILLEEDVELNHYHTLQLLLLLANSVEDPADTREYYNCAQDEYRIARAYHQEPDEVQSFDVLGVKLDRIRKVVEAESEEKLKAEGGAGLLDEDIVEASARGRPDFSYSVDGADDANDTFGRSGLEGATADKEETQSVDSLTFRPKPSKFMGSLKRKSLKPIRRYIKSELRSLSNIFKQGEQDPDAAQEERSLSYE